jgi:dihydrofolate reductase
MRKILVFNNLSLDGNFSDWAGSIDWAKRDSKEMSAHVRKHGGGIDTYLFGKETFEMFASFWPTPAGKAANPYFAKLLNESRKLVFSKSLKKTHWKGSEILPAADRRSIRALKASKGGDCMIFGSGALVRSLMISPVILGSGHALFSPLHKRVELSLLEAKPFKSGSVLLRYKPAPLPR